MSELYWKNMHDWLRKKKLYENLLSTFCCLDNSKLPSWMVTLPTLCLYYLHIIYDTQIKNEHYTSIPLLMAINGKKWQLLDKTSNTIPEFSKYNAWIIGSRQPNIIRRDDFISTFEFQHAILQNFEVKKSLCAI